MPSAEHPRVAIIGGGWAGCAAGVELAAAGMSVTLIEASRTLGGRARALNVNGHLLDNGQHILLGAYQECLRLMQQVGVDTRAAFLRLPLQLCFPPDSGGMHFEASRLPAPFHLLTALLGASGLDFGDKLALSRFMSAGRWMGWTLTQDMPLLTFLERHQQTPRLYELLWRPLCEAALNTAPAQASAAVFLRVLGDSVGASSRAASDMLLPREDLSALFPEAAAAYISARGGVVHRQHPVRALIREAAHWRIEDQLFDALILATDPTQAIPLLKPHLTEETTAHDHNNFHTQTPADIAQTDDADEPARLSPLAALQGLQHEPIATCYLQYPPQLRLERPFYALRDNPEQQHWGQFVFDRGQLFADQPGLLAVVISVASALPDISPENLTQAVARQLKVTLKQQLSELTPLWSRLVIERRAGFLCLPALKRPATSIGLAKLYLAGDYVAGIYPATLEAAARSGIAAARELLRNRQNLS